MAKPKFNTYYERNFTDEGTTFVEPSCTDETFRNETDIYYLLSRGDMALRTPNYGVEDDYTYADWQNEVAKMKRRFYQLSEEEQRYFGNAQNFFKFCSDPNNYDFYIQSKKEEVVVPNIPPEEEAKKE